MAPSNQDENSGYGNDQDSAVGGERIGLSRRTRGLSRGLYSDDDWSPSRRGQNRQRDDEGNRSHPSAEGSFRSMQDSTRELALKPERPVAGPVPESEPPDDYMSEEYGADESSLQWNGRDMEGNSISEGASRPSRLSWTTSVYDPDDDPQEYSSSGRFFTPGGDDEELVGSAGGRLGGQDEGHSYVSVAYGVWDVMPQDSTDYARYSTAEDRVPSRTRSHRSEYRRSGGSYSSGREADSRSRRKTGRSPRAAGERSRASRG